MVIVRLSVLCMRVDINLINERSTCLLNGQLNGYLTKDACINGALLSLKANKMAMVGQHLAQRRLTFQCIFFSLFSCFLRLAFEVDMYQAEISFPSGTRQELFCVDPTGSSFSERTLVFFAHVDWTLGVRTYC